MLTVRFDRLGALGGARVLDVGTGFGRHAFEVARRGGDVVAIDPAPDAAAATRTMLEAMAAQGETAGGRPGAVLRADATRLPLRDGAFDVVIASEVLEHIGDDAAALAEMARVLRPGGVLCCTVPRWFPEVVNWRLAEDYHAPLARGGHVRIYTRTELRAKLRGAGLAVRSTHHAHALHSPYWWLRCALGLHGPDRAPVRAYRRFLEWDITARPRATRVAERALDPLLGKSLVVYATKGAP